jgi:hypothetical protein
MLPCLLVLVLVLLSGSGSSTRTNPRSLSAYLNWRRVTLPVLPGSDFSNGSLG